MALELNYLAQLKQTPKYYAKGLYQELMEKDLFLWAQAIAFKALVAIVPIVILATAALAQILQSAEPFATVAGFVRDFLPPSESARIIDFLDQLQGAGNTLTIIGTVGLLLSAMSLFITLRISISNAFEQDWNKQRSILGGYLFDVRMVLQVGLFFVLTLGLSLATDVLNTAGIGFLDQIGLEYLGRGWQRIVTTLSVLVPFLITTAMFFQLFYFIPLPHPPKRSTLMGALFTGILWEAAKQGFSYYATYVGQFGSYGNGGGEAGLNALGNVFGLIIAFVLWVYFSGIVLMVGAIVASLHERYHRVQRRSNSPDMGASDKLDTAAQQKPVMNEPENEWDASASQEEGWHTPQPDAPRPRNQ